MRSSDADIVFAQRPRARRLQSRNETQERGFAAAGRPEQRDKLARLYAEIDVLQHRQSDAVDIKGVVDILDVEPGADGRIGNRLSRCMRYHLTAPFCQTSKRSRVQNNSVTAPEHSSDITINAAYMLA